MKLRILTPESDQEFEVVWVDIDTPAGNLVILKDHAPTIITLEKNKQIGFCLKNGKQENLAYDRGIVEVTRDYVKILLNS